MRLVLTALGLLLLMGCQHPYESKPHTCFQDQQTFETTVSRLEQDLLAAVAPLNLREEEGYLTVLLDGGRLDSKTQQRLKSHLTELVVMPVEIRHQPNGASVVHAEITVDLEPNTCRFNQQALVVSTYACQQLRNRYLSVVNKTAWHEGEQYQQGTSALTTGAVQRLFGNQLKSAERQPVTGE